MNSIKEIKQVYKKVGLDLNKLPSYSDPEEFGKQLAAKNRKNLFRIETNDGTRELIQNNA